jgi:cobalt-zinc-cadmium efflux system membrane fusion protein
MKKFLSMYGWAGIIIVFITNILLSSCQNNEAKTSNEKKKYVIPDSLFNTLEIDTVKKTLLVNALVLTGKVAFNDDNVAKIYSPVSGNIRDIKVMLGDYVKKDQSLAIINSYEMAGFSNELVNAQSNVRVQEKNKDAAEDMFKSGLASQKDLLAAQAAYEQALSELDRIKKVLKINGGNTQGEFILKAPLSGFVVEKFATNNMAIRTDNTNNLFTISDLKNVWIIANVYESNISEVHLNDNVEVTTLSYPGKVFKGKVDKILNVLDPTNKVMKVRIVLSNADYALKPEMFASVTIINNQNKKALSISSKSLVFDHNQYYVMVFHSKSDVVITPVQIINSIGEKTYISAGVQEGDKIIGSQAVLIYEALNS